MRGRLLSAAAVWLCAMAAVVQAQGLLIVETDAYRLPRPPIIIPPWPHPHPRPVPPPRPPLSYKIAELQVDVRLADQAAQVQVSQTFENTGSQTLETSFVFPLPYDGAVQSLTLMVDGKEHPARLLPADEARRLYEDIVRRQRDPALLEWIGTGLFRTSVFPVPPGAKRTVTLRYVQVCRKLQGLTDFLFPLSTAKYTSQPVERIEIRTSITSAADIKNVYSPTHPVEIKRPDPRRAVVVYTAKDTVPQSDFRLLFDVGKEKIGARAVSYRPRADEDGFFLLLASPPIKAADRKREPKTVMFVVDRSGSMSGKKIAQARGAARFLIDNLNADDLFNIIAYDHNVEAFRPELQRASAESRRAAQGFVEDLRPGGSTNIAAALSTALGQLEHARRPCYVIFLTDGLPTAGETREMAIVETVRKANAAQARIFSFGVGYDVNSRLLDRLVRDSAGQSQYVRPDEDIEDRVSRLYAQIEAPVLTGVDIGFSLDHRESDAAKPVNRVYPKGTFDLFAGEQLVVVGRYPRPGAARVTIRGKVGDEQQTFRIAAELVEKSADESNAFVEKLWAVRRVGEIVDQIDLHGKNPELVHELVELSTRHGILTPYTSFLADENVRLHDTANFRRAGENLGALSAATGHDGFVQRVAKNSMQNAVTAAVPAAEAYAAAMGPAAPPGVGRMMGMAAGGMTARPQAAPQQQTLRNVGNRAFFFRNQQWIDSTLSEKQQAQPKRIKQFSSEYFELARRHGRQLSQYLVFDEPVLLNVEGQAYLVEK